MVLPRLEKGRKTKKNDNKTEKGTLSDNGNEILNFFKGTVNPLGPGTGRNLRLQDALMDFYFFLDMILLAFYFPAFLYCIIVPIIETDLLVHLAKILLLHVETM